MKENGWVDFFLQQIFSSIYFFFHWFIHPPPSFNENVCTQLGEQNPTGELKYP